MELKYYTMDDNGEEVPERNLMKWAHWFETADRHIARTELPGGVLVLTVFLGMDHSIDPAVPILYYTRIEGGLHDEYEDRYSTKAEALKGHTESVRLAISGGGIQ